jgi:uncharacterized protein
VSQLTYRVAKLWGKPQGSSEKYDIDEKIEYPDDADLRFNGNFTGKLTFIRLKDEISALLNKAQITVKFTCTRCLKTFEKTILIPEAEREFFLNKPEFASDDLDDLFYIDRKPMLIDLSEMIRQEIILHFPLIPVCSNGCKGLCPACGKDRNKVKCACPAKKENPDIQRPFKNLKKLIQ